ncbi:hypothetical protein NLJ89_g8720 [Agrocybe chaxingu]|uniref:Uncharacterized protein n=1 Tax=Agrocybe chaxingu TaxID=84603 RepID=A0A9W8K1X7_9AGAR|nr:hypothetical protein NLJ89_g8720 [Agrocybe chaxingu]
MFSETDVEALLGLCDKFIYSGGMSLSPISLMLLRQPLLAVQWFNHPNTYDLDETISADHVGKALLAPLVFRTSECLSIANYIKLEDPKLAALIKKVNIDGSGARQEGLGGTAARLEPVGKPGAWRVLDFLQPNA